MGCRLPAALQAFSAEAVEVHPQDSRMPGIVCSVLWWTEVGRWGEGGRNGRPPPWWLLVQQDESAPCVLLGTPEVLSSQPSPQAEGCRARAWSSLQSCALWFPGCRRTGCTSSEGCKAPCGLSSLVSSHHGPPAMSVLF